MRRRPLVPKMAAHAVAALALSLPIALGGCAVIAPTPVTDGQARDRFVAILDDVQTLIGGGWTVMDDPTPRDCVIPVGVAGERYPALRVGDPPVDVADAAERVEQAWTTAGVRVTRTDVGAVIEVKGQTAAGELIVVRVSDSASTVTGESECRPR